jgi:ribose 5-phosphate isomerase B
MKVAISADHRGAPVIDQVLARVQEDGHEAEMFGNCKEGVRDYPDQAYQIARAVAEGRAERGILLCGTGIGMSIAANKVPGIRAAVVTDELTAQMSRGHNDANILCLSADLLGPKLIEKIVSIWLKTPFEGGRHGRRVQKIMMIESGQDPANWAEDHSAA